MRQTLRILTPAGAAPLLLLASALAQDPRSLDPEGGGDVPREMPADVLPHIRIDREAGHVDLEAEVILREADWLELLLCLPRTREHESILISPARPSHVHVALLMLGLEPGSPMRWERVDDEYITHPPTGDRLELYVIYEDEAGQSQKRPAHEWIRHQETGQAMQGHDWLFMGSVFETMPGRDNEQYMADLNGNTVSIVNFGDDLIGRDTEMTDEGFIDQWTTYTRRIPEEGTRVTLRIKPGQKDQEAKPDEPRP